MSVYGALALPATANTGAVERDAANVRGGLLTAQFVAMIVLAMIFMAASVVYALGARAAVSDPNDAFKTWDWWRITIPLLVVWPAAVAIYFIYQERKTSSMYSFQCSVSLGQSVMNLIYFMSLFVLAIGAAALITVFIFFVIDAAGDCSSDVCAGTELNGEISLAMWMLMSGSGAMGAATLVMTLLTLPIHSFNRNVGEAYANQRTNAVGYAQISKPIANVGDSESMLGDAELGVFTADPDAV